MTTEFTPQHWAGAVGVALIVALWVDRRWGEPPVRMHPVVWMGNFLGRAGDRVQRLALQDPEARDLRAFVLAALMWIAGAALFLIAALLLQGATLELPWWAAGVLMGLLLKPMLALAMLKSEVQAVEAALSVSLDAGRERLRWLVSRDVTQLTEVQVRESAIETLAENLNDSVVAPMFWFLLLGLPGAVLYRFANTADAMWGYPGVYKGQNWAWAGKWAARADDVLSWVPARITAVLLLLVAGRRGWALRSPLRAEARKTPSPNSGWPMAAMALVLGVALHKPAVYVLNPEGRAAQAADTKAAQVYASKAVLAQVVIALVALLLIAIGV
ncbi:adenosylcobinamide-phosphate synthase CbiB [Rhodoferax sp. TBRC 17198]|uniref:adenosylcobinamide-phosphate synthase CbiB n=1 Tax=Rhodoferax potami TaxID=3068338 RepID=UPI0028BE7B07|nr:adenosylcobinamide-phosphate synthase CbiB [Rhodoferax sp. TBRC 17198]MDT7521889.1 adenosylcobinamide-phosphate synthase CbiB [Rhodoferax sp. TBRC 17198]